MFFCLLSTPLKPSQVSRIRRTPERCFRTLLMPLSSQLGRGPLFPEMASRYVFRGSSCVLTFPLSRSSIRISSYSPLSSARWVRPITVTLAESYCGPLFDCLLMLETASAALVPFQLLLFPLLRPGGSGTCPRLALPRGLLRRTLHPPIGLVLHMAPFSIAGNDSFLTALPPLILGRGSSRQASLSISVSPCIDLLDCLFFLVPPHPNPPFPVRWLRAPG